MKFNFVCSNYTEVINVSVLHLLVAQSPDYALRPELLMICHSLIMQQITNLNKEIHQKHKHNTSKILQCSLPIAQCPSLSPNKEMCSCYIQLAKLGDNITNHLKTDMFPFHILISLKQLFTELIN